MLKSVKKVFLVALTVVFILVSSAVSYPTAANAQDNGLHLGHRLKNKHDNGLHLGQMKNKFKDTLLTPEQQIALKIGPQLFFDLLTYTAAVLNADEQTIIDKLKTGSTLLEIAEDYGVNETTFTTYLKDKIKETIDDALASDIITETQASALKNNLIETLKEILEYKFNDSNISFSAPKSLTAKALSDTKIALDWASVSGATSYHVYRSTSYSGTYSLVSIVTVSNYTDDDLSADTKYYYKVKAKNSSDTSDYSSIVYAVTNDNSDSDLSAPDDLTVTDVDFNEISLDWDSVSGATSYYVYRAVSYSGTYTLIAAVTSSYYTDDELSSDTKYYYKVKAINSSDTSDFSTIVYAKTYEE